MIQGWGSELRQGRNYSLEAVLMATDSTSRFNAASRLLNQKDRSGNPRLAEDLQRGDKLKSHLSKIRNGLNRFGFFDYKYILMFLLFVNDYIRLESQQGYLSTKLPKTKMYKTRNYQTSVRCFNKHESFLKVGLPWLENEG